MVQDFLMEPWDSCLFSTIRHNPRPLPSLSSGRLANRGDGDTVRSSNRLRFHSYQHRLVSPQLPTQDSPLCIKEGHL
jgi:hypothetical protein